MEPNQEITSGEIIYRIVIGLLCLSLGISEAIIASSNTSTKNYCGYNLWDCCVALSVINFMIFLFTIPYIQNTKNTCYPLSSMCRFGFQIWACVAVYSTDEKCIDKFQKNAGNLYRVLQAETIIFFIDIGVYVAARMFTWCCKSTTIETHYVYQSRQVNQSNTPCHERQQHTARLEQVRQQQAAINFGPVMQPSPLRANAPQANVQQHATELNRIIQIQQRTAEELKLTQQRLELLIQQNNQLNVAPPPAYQSNAIVPPAYIANELVLPAYVADEPAPPAYQN